MPQLDFIIAFPQIFWLIFIFFSFYTIIVHFFLPNFIKLVKSRRQIVLENNEILLTIKNKFNFKQNLLNENLSKNFGKTKNMLEKEILAFFSTVSFCDLDSVDMKISKILYESILYCDANILEAVSLKPIVLNLKDK